MNEYGDPGMPDIASPGEFRDALHDVLCVAESNDVTTTGTWPISAADAHWLIDVTRTDRRDTITPERFPATAIVRAVADREGVPATQLPPLYETVDPDVIDAIYEASSASGARVTFEYVGYTITFRTDGTIVVDD
jgi:hypothetical protein